MLGVGQPLFALGAVSDALIRIFDSRGDKGTPLTTVNVHSAPVTMLRMHPQLNAVHTHTQTHTETDTQLYIYGHLPRHQFVYNLKHIFYCIRK